MSHAKLLGELGVTRPTEFDHLPDELVFSTVLAWQSDPRRKGPGLLVWMLRHAKTPAKVKVAEEVEELMSRARVLSAWLQTIVEVEVPEGVTWRLYATGRANGPQAMEQLASRSAGGLVPPQDLVEVDPNQLQIGPPLRMVPRSEDVGAEDDATSASLRLFEAAG